MSTLSAPPGSLNFSTDSVAIRYSPHYLGTRVERRLRCDRGGDLSLTLETKTRCLRGLDRLLLQDQGFVLIVRFDELHRDQHGFHPKGAQAYPDIARLAVPVHEKLPQPYRSSDPGDRRQRNR